MEKVRREKMQVREKVGKSQNTVFFQCFCGSGGLKSRLAKAAGAETSGQISDEKLHAVVAGSTSGSENVQNTILGPFLEIEMLKKCTRLWREAHFQSKCVNHHTFGPLLDLQMSSRCRKCTRHSDAKHISKSKVLKTAGVLPVLSF